MTITDSLSSAVEQSPSIATPASTEELPTPLLTLTQRADLRVQWKALIAKHTADKAAWKALPGMDRNAARPPTLPAYAHMLYAVLLGRDWRKGFTQPSNARKLENGALCSWRYRRAAYYFRQAMITAATNSPEDAAKTAPFHLFVESVPAPVQLACVRRLPPLPEALSDCDYTAAKLLPAWPSEPYREELHADAPTAE